MQTKIVPLVDRLKLARQAAHNWQHLGPAGEINAVEVGLLNWTFKITLGEQQYILQRLHPVFKTSVHFDIQAVTDHLRAKKFLVPQLLKTHGGELSVNNDSGCWRLQSFINGQTLHVVESPQMAYSAAHLVGNFHAAMQDFQHQYFFVREEAHNTPLYLDRLKKALTENQQHRLFASVQKIATQVLEQSSKLPNLWLLPLRHCHGDLKFSNIIVDDKKNCVSLIDWDTVGLLPWPMEFGDALRSWCNPQGEDASTVSLDEEIFSAAVAGYADAAKNIHSAEEIDALVDGLLVISLELTARFLTDALLEIYFSFNQNKYASLGEHNLLRAQGQWALHNDVLKKAEKLRLIVQKSF